MINTEIYYKGSQAAAAAREHYRRFHHAAFPGFIRAECFVDLKRDVDSLLEMKKRKDFLMACMDHSPRKMNVVNGPTVEQWSKYIPEIYRSRELLDFISDVIDEQALILEEDIDRFVINQLEYSSDTFGAHYDDYPLSFVIILESPGAAGGGYSEMVPNAKSLSDLEGKPIRLPLKAGDAYLLKADTTAHRVAPLTADAKRTAINLAYTTPGYVVKETESAAMLYTD